MRRKVALPVRRDASIRKPRSMRALQTNDYKKLIIRRHPPYNLIRIRVSATMWQKDVDKLRDRHKYT